MKKTGTLLLIIIVCCLSAAALVACGGDTCRVEFYVDGALYEYFLVEKGGYIEEVPAVPAKDGMTGVWSETYFEVIESDMKVYAVYSESYFTVTFTVDGEVLQTYKVKKNMSLASVPSVPVKDGYVGVWSVTDFSSVDRDITVYAVYTELTSSVTFMNGDEVVSVEYADGGQLSVIPAVPEKADLTGKWITVENGTVKDADFSSITEDMTVYAYYFVTLTLVDAYSGEDIFITDIGEEVESVSAGTRDGYDFLGWYTDPDYRNEVSFPAAFEKNTILYARWINNYADAGFTFVNGLVTGYTGSETNVSVPYKYTENGEEVIVKAVADGAFQGQSFVSVILPSTVTEIGADAFANCPYLTEVNFSDGSYIEKIGDRAFYSCSSLEGFEFSIFTSEIGVSAFENCTAARVYDGLGESVAEVISDYAFKNNTLLAEIVLPETLTEIGVEAFAFAVNTEFEFRGAANLAVIGNGAFKGCVNLYEFSAPALVSAGTGVFADCYSLRSVTTVSNIPLYSLFGETEPSSGRFYAVDGEDGKRYYLPESLFTVLVNPNVQSDQTPAGTLTSGAFKDAYSVKDVILSSGIVSVESYAFAVTNSESLSSSEFNVTMPSGLKEISAYAFAGRRDLRKINFPVSLESIEERAFYGLDKLAEVTIGDNSALVFVGKEAFGETPWFANYVGVVKLGRVALGISETYASSVGKSSLSEDDFRSVDTISEGAFYGNSRIAAVSLPSTVISVGDEAFRNMKMLTSVSLTGKAVLGENVFGSNPLLAEIKIGASRLPETLFAVSENESSDYIVYVKDGVNYYIPVSLKKITIVPDETTEIVAGIYEGFGAVEEYVLEEGFTVIYDGAFADNIYLEKVTLPSTLTSLGVSNGEEARGVFDGDGRLYEVSLRKGSVLSYIGDKTFYETSLGGFTFPSALTYIGKSAFENTALRRIVFESGDENLVINERAFYDSLKKDVSGWSFRLDLPDNLTEIGAYAFYGCDGITELTLGKNVTVLGEYAFAYNGLSSIIIPEKVNFYKETVSENSSSTEKVCVSYGLLQGNPLRSLTLYSAISLNELFAIGEGDEMPSLLTEITVAGGDIVDGQFAGLTSLQTLNLINVGSVGASAFEGCTDLLRVTLPRTVVSVGDRAFAQCTSLSSFVFEENSATESIGEYLFDGCVMLKSTVFPESVKNQTFTGVFKGCVSLIEATIPSSVTEIGEYAFYDNRVLGSITLPEGVVSVGNHAFENCTVLEFSNIRFDDLVSVGSYAFAGCGRLKGVKAENISSIGEGAFSGCSEIKEITIVDETVSYYIDREEIVVTVNVSSAAVEVAAGAFSGCDELTNVMLFTSAENINDMLTSVKGELPAQVKVFVTKSAYAVVSEELKTFFAGRLYVNPSEIQAEYEFNEETGEATLTNAAFDGDTLFLPSYVEKDGTEYALSAIGDSVFKGNTSIKELIIPFTVKRIGNYSFKNSAIEIVRFEIGSQLSSIGDEAFFGCAVLKEIELPDSLTEIGNRAFYEAVALENVENSGDYSLLSVIGEYAFYRTASLKTISFGKNLKLISANAFNGSGLTSFTIAEGATTLISSGSFAYCDKLTDVNVPVGCTIEEGAFPAGITF